VTGDYSRGAAGFLGRAWRDSIPGGGDHHRGQLARHVQGIAAVGDDIDARGGTRVGSILLEEMTIAGE
jgi:PmbA protein